MNTLNHPPSDSIIHGDCIQTLRTWTGETVDFILTDPPYLVRYRSRDGQSIRNDDNDAWLKPTFAELYRVLKKDSYCVSFYGWNNVEKFVRAWKDSGFRIVGHLVFRKGYTSGGTLLRRTHECAYLLAKGDVRPPTKPISDVIEFKYTGNRLHPTQKPISSLAPLIESFCPSGGLVLDPFCGSGSTLIAAQNLNRHYLGIEIDLTHHNTARNRILLRKSKVETPVSAKAS